MKIWLDADACPKPVKQILYRASDRENLELVLVSNSPFHIPKNPLISMVVVEKGFDVADGYIVERVSPGDLVITADIPLAAEVVGKGCLVLDSRGTLYDAENVQAKLATRNLLSSLRDERQAMGDRLGGGPPPFSEKDKNRFASALNQFLQARKKVD